MRVLAALCLALAACFGPNVGDGALKCEVGDECPPAMYCRLECGRRCFFNPSGSCGEDAAVPDSPVDTPMTPIIDGPVAGMPDVPVIGVADGPVVGGPPDAPVLAMPDAPVLPLPDVPAIAMPDAPPTMTPDACAMIAAVDDAGITTCTVIMKPRGR